jgi:peroxiredoxin
MENYTRAPNFILYSTEGEQVALSEVLEKGEHVLLVFLRHLG